MRTTSLLAAVTFTLISAALLVPHDVAGGERCRQESLATLVRDCAGDDAGKVAEAITQLRSAGQDGLNALCVEHDRLMAARNPSGTPIIDTNTASACDDDTQIARMRRAIDAVARQRDAYASQLFWHTDFEQAKAQATASGKPILSLRLLGRLDEDRSCANSRFFRSVLYANQALSDYLREHFILHWESLRPVPQLTIDFGDGRRIERTITGNSIHYVLDSSGGIIDAIPGLYGPQAFNAAIQQAEAAALNVMAMNDPAERHGFLDNYHREAADAIAQAWVSDLQQTGVNDDAIAAALLAARPAAALGAMPEAREAMPLAPSKARVEAPALAASTPPVGDILRRSPETATGLSGLMNDQAWTQIAALHADEAALDGRSVALIRNKMPALETAEEAQRRTSAKRVIEDPVVKVLNEFQRSIATDTVRNEYLFHRTIHQWLMDQDASADVKVFNGRVYADLFLTPLDDPWMGLAPRDAYAAIDGGGLIDECGD